MNIRDLDIDIKKIASDGKLILITHSNVFHADEVMATAMLLYKFRETYSEDDIYIYRVNTVPEIPQIENVIIYDIGQGELDHHQPGGNGERDGILYASCGLVWKKYFSDLPTLVFKSVEEEICKPIDYCDTTGETVPGALPLIIFSYNPVWDSTVDSNRAFEKALHTAYDYLENVIAQAEGRLRAIDGIKKAVKQAKDGIMILDRYMPWDDIIGDPNITDGKIIRWCIYPSNRGGYNAQGTKIPFEHLFPKAWAGLRNEALEEASGIKDVTFCHNGLFLLAANTIAAAIAAVRKAEQLGRENLSDNV